MNRIYQSIPQQHRIDRADAKREVHQLLETHYVRWPNGERSSVTGRHVRFLSHNSLKAKDRAALFVPPIADLKPAIPLALDDDFAVPLAQFDLAIMSARAVNLLSDQSRALPAVGLSAFHEIAASVDAKGRRCGIEIGLKHVGLRLFRS
jgi:hypothetical protein